MIEWIANPSLTTLALTSAKFTGTEKKVPDLPLMPPVCLIMPVLTISTIYIISTVPLPATIITL
jgi:hypothetical protein